MGRDVAASAPADVTQAVDALADRENIGANLLA
jgi:hypothetical protein